DRVLNTGVVVVGEVVISVADIDLVYLSLNLILTSVETARGRKNEAAQAAALQSES
ncbi:MAG: gas vesicle protein, partial [Planctomycetota bacterium]|nr:gas vesicle protein [Planctomycetota bacterium]